MTMDQHRLIAAQVEIPKELAEAEVVYAILHGWKDIPCSIVSDMDIVVEQKDWERVEAVLDWPGRRRIVQALPYAAHSICYVVQVSDVSLPDLVSLDVSLDYRVRNRVVFSGQDLLVERRRWQDFWVAAPDREFAYLLVKRVYDKGSVPTHQRERLRELIVQLGPEALAIARRLFGNAGADTLIHCIAAEEWERLDVSIPHLAKGLRWQVVKRDPLNPLRFWWAELARALKRWRQPTGLMVVVLGADGSGKSSVIQALETKLAKAFRQHRRFHFRPGLIPKRGGPGVATKPHKYPPYSPVISVLKLLVVALDFLLGYWLRLRPALVRSTLLLFDRYYDDLLVDPMRYRYGAAAAWVRLLRRLVPRPNLWVLLDAPIDVLRSRKQEVDEQEMQRQGEAYRGTFGGYRNVIVVDASRSLDEVAQEVAAHILDYLAERYRRQRQVWLPKV